MRTLSWQRVVKMIILLINNRAVVKRLVLIVYGRSLEGCPEGE